MLICRTQRSGVADSSGLLRQKNIFQPCDKMFSAFSEALFIFLPFKSELIYLAFILLKQDCSCNIVYIYIKFFPTCTV